MWAGEWGEDVPELRYKVLQKEEAISFLHISFNTFRLSWNFQQIFEKENACVPSWLSEETLVYVLEGTLRAGLRTSWHSDKPQSALGAQKEGWTSTVGSLHVPVTNLTWLMTARRSCRLTWSLSTGPGKGTLQQVKQNGLWRERKLWEGNKVAMTGIWKIKYSFGETFF